MKKSKLSLLIRTIVREEVAMAIKEVVTELKQPKQQVSKPKKSIVEGKQFTNNSILNEVMNETAQSDEWKTLGGGTFDSGKMSDVLSSQYNDTAQPEVTSPGAPDFMTKDYRQVLQKVEEKTKQKRGV